LTLKFFGIDQLSPLSLEILILLLSGSISNVLGLTIGVKLSGLTKA
jgi:hypothetical protein